MDSSKSSSKEEVKSVDESNAARAFSSTCSTYVTLLGYTVGMSDIWRFPFLVYRNGGGAFFIPFILTIFLCGIPLFFMEYAISNFSGKGPYLVWDICPLFRGIGTTLAVAYMVYMAGTTVFRGWLSIFLVNSFQDPLPWTHCHNEWNTAACRHNHFDVSDVSDVSFYTNISYDGTNGTSSRNLTSVSLGANSSDSKFMTAAEQFWQYEALGLSSSLTDLGGLQWRLVLFIAILRLLVFLCASNSIASIEKVMYVLLFAPVLFMVSVFVQSLTLPGASLGLYKFFYPEFSKLVEPRIWVEAFLMVFYTLAFGWGGILTLGKHASFKDNCIRTSLWLPMMDALFGIMNGAVCFSVLGNMAYTHNVEVDEVLTTGFAAGIVSYVTSLSALPAPQVWNCAFFITAIMAGLDSQIIPVEMCVQIIGEAFPKLFPRYRLYVLGAVSMVLFLLALPTCTGAGGYMFLWCDWYVGVWTGPICAFVEVVTVAWIYGIDRFNEDIKLMTGRNMPGFHRITVSVVAPVLVLVIFLTACVNYVPPKYGEYNYPSWARGLGWTVVAVIVSPILLKAVLQIKQQRGRIGKKIRTSIATLPSWGPKEVSAKEGYFWQRSVLEGRPIKELFRYILFGSTREHLDEGTKQELSSLNMSA